MKSFTRKKIFSKKKTLLCKNINNKYGCNREYSCIFAHHLNEQKKTLIREKIFTVLNNNRINLSNWDLINDKKLFKSMRQLTKLCINCTKNICPGGYNCKHGAFNSKYIICNNNFMNGKCENVMCKNIHLTKQGLVPYNIQRIKSLKQRINSNDFTDLIFKTNDNNINESSDSDDGDIDKIKKYLENSDSVDSLEESIFIE